MKTSALAIISVFNIRNLGVCALCMQISFFSMIASWLIFLGTISLSYHFGIAFFALAVALTFLWLGHIMSRARKIVSATSFTRDCDDGPKSQERRDALRGFGQALVGAAAVSAALPLTTSAANAQTSGSTDDILDALREEDMDSALDEEGAVIMTSCSNRCKKDSDCSAGCICWPELGRCVKLGK